MCRSCWRPASTSSSSIWIAIRSTPSIWWSISAAIAPLTVMVYSAQADPEMLVRCMRAGAREFLSQPIAPSTIAEALVRASVRRPAVRAPKKTLGRLLIFAGAKGGSGVSTIASNFAIMLAQESEQNTLLLDLDLPLGAAALDLGITTQFSTANALQDISRLDSNFSPSC